LGENTAQSSCGLLPPVNAYESVAREATELLNEVAELLEPLDGGNRIQPLE
jgi:hypothetical protein